MATVRELRARFTGDASGLKSTINGINQNLGTVQEQTKRTTKTMSERFEAASKKMRSAGKNMTTYVTAPMAAMGTAAFAAANDFDKAYQKIRVGTGATGKDLERLKNDFKEVFKDVPDDAATVADALSGLNTMTGATGDTLQGLTKTVLEASRLLGEDGVANANAFGNALQQWGIPAEEGEEKLNALFKATQDYGVGMGDLIGNLNKFGPVMQNAGFTMEETADMMGRMEKGGIQVTRVMPGLNMAFRKWAEEGKNSREEFERISQRMRDAETDTEALSMATEAFGAEGAQRLTTAIRQGIIPTLDELGQPLKDTEGLIMETGEETRTFGERLMELKNRAQVAIEPFGRIIMDTLEAIFPYIEKAMTYVERFAESFSGLDPPIKTLIGLFAGFVAALGPILIALAPIVSVMGKFRLGMLALTGPIGATVAILAGLVTAGVALYKNWDTVREKIDPLIDGFVLIMDNLDVLSKYFLAIIQDGDELNDWITHLPDEMQGPVKRAGEILDMFRDAAIKAFDFIVEHGKPILDEVVAFVMDAVNRMRDFWEENGAQILEAAENAFNGIMAVVEFVMPFILGLIKSIWGNIQGVINGALDIIMGLIKTFSGALTGDFSKMWEGIKQLFSGAVEFIWNFIQLTFYGRILKGAKSFVGAMRSSIDDMWKGIVALFKGSTKEAWDLIRGAWTTISDETVKVFNAIWKFFRDIWRTLTSFIKTTVTTIRTGIISAWNLISNGTTKVFNSIWKFLRNLWDTISDFLRSSGEGIFKRMSNTWDDIFNATKNVFNSVFNFFKSVFRSIRDFLDDSVDNILSRVTTAWDDIFSATKRIFNDIKDNITGIFDDIVEGAKNLPGRMADGISSMAHRLTSGVKSMLNSVINLAEGGLNALITGVNWILRMMTSETRVDPVSIDRLAHGTNRAHPGGLAILGDGRGDNAGREYVETPDGKGFFSEPKDTLYNLPKGTRVMSARDTRKAFGDMIPKYALGNWWQDAKEAGTDVREYMSDKIANMSLMTKNMVDDYLDPIEAASGKMFYEDWSESPRELVNQTIRNMWTGFAGSLREGKQSLARLTTLIPDFSIYEPERGGIKGQPAQTVAGAGWDLVRKAAIKLVGKDFPEQGEPQEGYPAFPEPFVRNQWFGRDYGGSHAAYEAHTGIDFGAPVGTPIPAQASGEVYHSSAYGGSVRVRNGAYTYSYAHMKDRYVNEGDWVNRNDIIGTVGTVTTWIPDPNGDGVIASGMDNMGETYPHVHYSVRRNGELIDPYSLNEPTDWTSVLRSADLTGPGTDTANIAAPAQIRRYIQQAIDATGVPDSWLGPLQTLVMKESAGNIHAQNNWDINAARGTPSKGLAQVIPPTFAANKEPGMNDIWNPVHNVAAAINYITRRYGNIWNTPGFKSMANGGGWKGYADGGIVDQKQLAWIAEGGWAESIISHDPSKRSSQEQIWEQTGRDLGFLEGNSEQIDKMIQLLEGILDKTGTDLSNMSFNIPVVINGREIAKASASDIDAELARLQKMKKRATGRR